jgi:hypothetical protein
MKKTLSKFGVYDYISDQICENKNKKLIFIKCHKCRDCIFLGYYPHLMSREWRNRNVYVDKIITGHPMSHEYALKYKTELEREHEEYTTAFRTLEELGWQPYISDDLLNVVDGTAEPSLETIAEICDVYTCPDCTSF